MEITVRLTLERECRHGCCLGDVEVEASADVTTGPLGYVSLSRDVDESEADRIRDALFARWDELNPGAV